MPISPRPVAGAIVTVSALLALAVPALAGTTTTSSSSTTTTTSSSGAPSSTTSSSSSTSSTLKPLPSTTSTTAKPGTSSSTTSTTTSSSSTSSTSTSTSTTTTVPPDAVPPEVQAWIDAYPRTPSSDTDELDALLAALPPRAALGGYGRFPVAGEAWWSHDFLFPRHSPSFHVHEGTDVFAAKGTPVVSPAAGEVQVSNGSIGGLAVKVVQDDGTWWYLAHLASVSVEDGDPVLPGDVVGTVGNSGNAKGGSPHVHLEIHPLGGDALDPKRVLDAIYAEALAAAPAFLDAYEMRALLRADHLDRPPAFVPPVSTVTGKT